MRSKLTKGEKALLLRMQDNSSLGKFKYVEVPAIGDTYLVFAKDDGRVTAPETRYLPKLISFGYLETKTAFGRGSFASNRRYVLTDIGKQTIQELLKQDEHAK